MRGVFSHAFGWFVAGLMLAGAVPARGDAILLPGSVANETALPFDPTSGLPQEPSNSTPFTALPSVVTDSANVNGAVTVGTYNLTPTQFQFDFVHDASGTGADELFQVTSEGNIFFQVTEATAYTISGSQTVNGSDRDPFAFALVSLTPVGENELFFLAAGVSPLATTQTDLGTPLTGSATGTLLPGVTYELDYLFTTSNTASTTHLSLALAPPEPPLVPLPGALGGGVALLAGLAVARQRRSLA